MKKIIIFGLMFIVCLSLVSADWCYQETATVATACGGLDSGNYLIDWTDGTYRIHRNPDSGIFYYINYSKPNNVTSGLWQIKYGDDKIVNFSLPSTCFNRNIIELKMRTDVEYGTSLINFYCYDGTDFFSLYDYYHGYGYTGVSWTLQDITSNAIDGDWSTGVNIATMYTPSRFFINMLGEAKNFTIYEEAMWWDIEGSDNVEEIPEFTTVGAVIALAGSLGVCLVKKK